MSNVQIEQSVTEKFTTRDLYLAATLLVFKFEMISLDFQHEGGKQNPVGYFSFRTSDELKETVKKYNQGLLVVEPKQFITCMRSLKAELNNYLKNPYRQETEIKTAP